MMNFKAIVTVIFSAVLMFCLTACKDTPKSADNSSSDPVAVSDTVTTTSTTTTAAATTAGTKRKTTTTTNTSAATTQTTLVTTVTTVPTTTTTVATTVTTTTTTSAVTTSTAAPIVTTTTAAPVTMAGNVASTVYMIQDDVTLEYVPITVYYYNEQPENATLQAYSDLAETGILTDEIREFITADVMNYAIKKYGCWHDTTHYANSTTDYNGGFDGGATNGEFRMNFYTIACLIKWGAIEADYIAPSLNDNAKSFQSSMYSWVDSTIERLLSDGGDSTLIGANIGFCWLGENALGGAVVVPGDSVYENGGKVYQVSFIY